MSWCAIISLMYAAIYVGMCKKHSIYLGSSLPIVKIGTHLLNIQKKISDPFF